MANRPAAVISIVDDDASVGEATGSLLRANGFTVATFLSAALFLASPERDRTTLLILDVRMPGMCGRELYREGTIQAVQARNETHSNRVHYSAWHTGGPS
jgi:FixJ family two-component response regulator